MQRLLNITEQYWTRTYHPPLDPVNAMLSFGYTLLFNNVFSLVLAEGLNPHLGNLHGAERAKAYLAFDLMEEFRSPIVDTVVMKLINQKVMKPSDFTGNRRKAPGLRHGDMSQGRVAKHSSQSDLPSTRRLLESNGFWL
jgi:CRISPR-associated endonuclease Cas1